MFSYLLFLFVCVALANSAPSNLKTTLVKSPFPIPKNTPESEDIITENSAPKSTTKIEDAGTEDNDPLGDRINLNWSQATAHAHNDRGGYSGVKANTWGSQAGILNVYTGQYTSLGNNAGSDSSSYSSGHNAPKTWATGTSLARPGSASGSAESGFSGGRGSAHSTSNSQNLAYDLGNGNVLLNNFKTTKKEGKNKTTSDKSLTVAPLESNKAAGNTQDD